MPELTIEEALALITNPEVKMYLDTPIVRDLLMMMTASPKIGDYYGMYHWVLEHGQYFVNEEEDRQFGPISECFFTSQLAATNDFDLLYVEGYVQAAAHPVPHGWNITQTGMLIDRTLRVGGCDYWGVVFNTEFVMKDYVRRGAIVSLIGNWEENFPLIRNEELRELALHSDWNHDGTNFRCNPDERLRQTEREFVGEGTLANFEQYRRQRQRTGDPIPPNEAGHTYDIILSQLLLPTNGIAAEFDEGNWSGYPDRNRNKIWIEIFWHGDIFSHDVFTTPPPEFIGPPQRYTIVSRDVISVTIDLENNIYQLVPLLRHQESNIIEAPQWVLDAESEAWRILREAFALSGLAEGEISWQANNPDEDLRELQRIYDSDPTSHNLRRLQTARTRAGEGRIIHLRRLAEEVAELIDAKESPNIRDTRTWEGEYQGIKIHINARRLYYDHRNGFLQIGRAIARFEVRKYPQIEINSHPEEPIYVNEGEGVYYTLLPEQPWLYDAQALLDYLMELNARMEAGEWYQQWRETNAQWLI